MNIIQQHERVRFLLDAVASPRFSSEDIDNALNGEIDEIVREKYDQYRLNNRSDAFQRTQRVRDELRNIVKELGTTDFTLDDANDTVTLDDPDGTGYMYLLSFKVKFTTAGWMNCTPQTYDRKNVAEKNPFRRVRSGPYPKVYYNEQASNIFKITHPFTSDSFANVEAFYLAAPTIVNYGVEYDSTETFANGTKVIAVEQTVYAGTTYVIGEKFTIVNPNNSITSGLVVANFVETELSVSLHQELARRAASSALKTAKEYDKANAIMQDAIAT